jgi:hypothetical protein
MTPNGILEYFGTTLYCFFSLKANGNGAVLLQIPCEHSFHLIDSSAHPGNGGESN